jgi:hypothetical protein
MFTPPTSSTPQSAGTPTLQGPIPAGQEAGGTLHPSQQAAGGMPNADAATPAPWQRLDATWPTILKSPTGLDGDAQHIVRYLLTQATGKRLQRRRHLEAASLRLWEPNPNLAEYVRQHRYYAPGLYRFQTPDIYGLLFTEARLTLEVVETAPGVLGVEVWQELLELQCRRIGQLYTELQRCLGRRQAQAALQHLLEGLA